MNLPKRLGDDTFEVRAECEMNLAIFSAALFLRQTAKLVEPRANERVAAAKVVVEKVQRLVARNRGEPKRKFCQLNREWIQVNAVDAGFDDTATPSCNLGLFLRYTFAELRLKFCCRMINDVVGEINRGFDKEMAAAHRRIANVQLENFAGKRIFLAGFDIGVLSDFRQQRLKGFFDDIFYNVIRRVVSAGGFAFAFVGLEFEFSILADEMMFKQPFVNRAELLDA